MLLKGKLVRSFTPNETGLSNSISTVFAQTNATVWVGSRERGLARYDGDKFRGYTSRDGLASDAIRRLFCDSKGRLWIGTDSGVSLWDGKAFTHFSRSGGHLMSDLVNCFFEDSSGNIWTGTQSGVSRIKDGVWTALDVRDGISANEIREIFEDPLGIFWLCTNRGITQRNAARAGQSARTA